MNCKETNYQEISVLSDQWY